MGLNGLALNHTSWVDYGLNRCLLHVDKRVVEQEPGQHLLVMHGLRDMIDRDQSRSGEIGHLRGFEIDIPEPVESGLVVHEIQKAAAEAANRRDVQLAGPNRLLERLVQKRGGT